MTEKETEDQIDKFFMASVHTSAPGILWGTNEKDLNLATMTIKDVPDADRQAITASFAKAGIAKPSDSAILRAYWTNATQGQIMRNKSQMDATQELGSSGAIASPTPAPKAAPATAASGSGPASDPPGGPVPQTRSVRGMKVSPDMQKDKDFWRYKILRDELNGELQDADSAPSDDVRTRHMSNVTSLMKELAPIEKKFPTFKGRYDGK